jgi:ketosteroid isomerase-like protein
MPMRRDPRMVLEDNKQRVLDYFEALVADDFARIAEIFSPDVRWWMPRTAETRYGMPVPTVGLERFLELQRQGLEEIYHPQRWTTHTVIGEGDFVAAFTTLEAETSDGARYSNDYLFLFRFSGETIAEFWEFVDTLYVQEFFASITGTAATPGTPGAHAHQR